MTSVELESGRSWELAQFAEVAGIALTQGLARLRQG